MTDFTDTTQPAELSNEDKIAVFTANLDQLAAAINQGDQRTATFARTQLVELLDLVDPVADIEAFASYRDLIADDVIAAPPVSAPVGRIQQVEPAPGRIQTIEEIEIELENLDNETSEPAPGETVSADTMTTTEPAETVSTEQAASLPADEPTTSTKPAAPVGKKQEKNKNGR